MATVDRGDGPGLVLGSGVKELSTYIGYKEQYRALC